jgi:hypothetical protein
MEEYNKSEQKNFDYLEQYLVVWMQSLELAQSKDVSAKTVNVLTPTKKHTYF